MIETVAAALTSTLGRTVYYGILPDDEGGSLDSAVAVIDYPMGRQRHDFGEAGPAMTEYGIEVRARASTQAAARTLCQSAYDALLSQGYLAVSPPIHLRQDEKGRSLVVAQVQAYEARA